MVEKESTENQDGILIKKFIPNKFKPPRTKRKSIEKEINEIKDARFGKKNDAKGNKKVNGNDTCQAVSKQKPEQKKIRRSSSGFKPPRSLKRNEVSDRNNMKYNNSNNEYLPCLFCNKMISKSRHFDHQLSCPGISD